MSEVFVLVTRSVIPHKRTWTEKKKEAEGTTQPLPTHSLTPTNMLRPTLRLLSNAEIIRTAPTPASRLASQLLQPIPLYRRLLRVHRKALPIEMRVMGDSYVKVSKLVRFNTSWLELTIDPSSRWLLGRISENSIDRESPVHRRIPQRMENVFRFPRVSTSTGGTGGRGIGWGPEEAGGPKVTNGAVRKG